MSTLDFFAEGGGSFRSAAAGLPVCRGEYFLHKLLVLALVARGVC